MTDQMDRPKVCRCLPARGDDKPPIYDPFCPADDGHRRISTLEGMGPDGRG